MKHVLLVILAIFSVKALSVELTTDENLFRKLVENNCDKTMTYRYSGFIDVPNTVWKTYTCKTLKILVLSKAQVTDSNDDFSVVEVTDMETDILLLFYRTRTSNLDNLSKINSERADNRDRYENIQRKDIQKKYRIEELLE